MERTVPVESASQNGGLIVRMRGEYDPAEGIKILEKLVSKPDGPRAVRVLYDIRQSVPLPDFRSVQQYANRWRSLSRTVKHVGILVDDPAHFGTSRQFGGFAQQFGVVVEVFVDEAEAHHWLSG